jgi:hypothetical protein
MESTVERPGSADDGWADARRLIDDELARRGGAEPVSAVGVRRYLEGLCWPVDDGSFVPSSLYWTAGLPEYVTPEGDHPLMPPIPIAVPGPGRSVVATGLDIRFGVPLREHDRISSSWRLVTVEPKRTRLGDGAFLTFEATFSNQRAETVAVERTSVLRYTPSTAAQARPGAAPVDPLPSDFAPLELRLTLQRLVILAGATRDFAPHHHDVEHARSLGADSAFLTSVAAVGLVERTLRTRFGHGVKILRIGPIAMGDFLTAGHVLRCGGLVTMDGPLATVDWWLQAAPGVKPWTGGALLAVEASGTTAP